MKAGDFVVERLHAWGVDASARLMAAPAYERWLRSFKFLYDRSGMPLLSSGDFRCSYPK
jgi:hypothetical protein